MAAATDTSLAARGQLHTGNILDCGQQETMITVALTPQNDTASHYSCEMTQEELCHAMGVNHLAAEHLNLESIQLKAVDAPLPGSLAFTLHQKDSSQKTGYSQLPTATRAVVIDEQTAMAHHFVHPNGATTFEHHQPLKFDERSHNSSDAQAAAVRRAARWADFLRKNKQIDTASIMKGVTTMEGENKEVFHLVPNLKDAQGDLSANAGALAKLCDINSSNPAFVNEYFQGEGVTSNGVDYHVLNGSAVSALQDSLKANLSPTCSQIQEGLSITAKRFGGKSSKASKELLQEPMYATFNFVRFGQPEPQGIASAIQSLEGPDAKAQYMTSSESEMSAGQTNQLVQDLSGALGGMKLKMVETHN